jgi:hypothetical protein
MPQRVGEGLDGSRPGEREAVQDEQQVEVPQRQLAVMLQQRQAHATEMPPEQWAGVFCNGRQRRFVGSRGTTRPPVLDHRPQELVDRQRLAVGGLLALHPVHRLPIECVQRVDGPLSASLQHVPIDPRHPDRLPSRRVRVVLEPAGGRRQRTMGPRSRGAI